MNVVTESPDARLLSCSCGATALNNASSRGRFLRRHPEKCSKREEEIQKFMHRLAEGTRCVDDEENRKDND